MKSILPAQSNGGFIIPSFKATSGPLLQPGIIHVKLTADWWSNTFDWTVTCSFLPPLSHLPIDFTGDSEPKIPGGIRPQQDLAIISVQT